MSDAKDWIQTYSGRKFYPLDPDLASVDIFDVAHALSNICRYTGHVKRFYSVAEHSVRVARRVRELTGDPEQTLWGLLHDASEAYIADIARPVKHQPEMSAYRVIEARLQATIMQALRLSAVQPDAVTQADNEMLWSEAPRLFKGGLHPDWQPRGEALKLSKLGWTPEVAELRFLMEYRAIRKDLR